MNYSNLDINTLLSKNASRILAKLPVVGLTLCVITMVGCASQRPATRKIYVQPAPATYVVQRGDTLSKITSRYGLDYRQVGAMNGLDSNYTIYPGQRLILNRNARSTVVRTSNAPSISRAPVANSYPNGYSTSYPRQPSQPVRVVTQSPVVNMQQHWLRPTNGQLLRPFNQAGGVLGMWFEGQQGTPVVASQAGTVLYVGSDLAEYGKLVMIQHSGDYISAYAHLNSFAVQEKQVIQAGQQIGSIGYAPTMQQPALEFQVRYRGTPIDPTPLFK